MGIRFRKSVKIFKGMKINFAKTGVSMSLGGKGLSTNIGHKGITQTVGVPGTGVSYRHTMGSSSHQSSSRSQTRPNGSNHSKSNSNVQGSFILRMNNDGHILIQNDDGTMITDETLLRKIKSTEAYHLKKQELEYQRQAWLKQTFEEAYSENERLINIHRLSAEVATEKEYEKALNELKPQLYISPVFSAPHPDIEEIRLILTNEAKEKVHGSIFKIGHLRKQYVEDNLQERYSSAVSEWENAGARFAEWQKKKSEEENQRYQQEYANHKEHLEKIIKGDYDTLDDAIDGWLSSCEFPLDLTVDYSLLLEKKAVMLDIDLPEIEDIPTTEIVKLESGNLRERNKTQATLKKEYATFVLGLAIFVASNIFNMSPYIERIVVSGYTQRRNKIGDIKDDYVYSVQFTRDNFENSILRNVDPIVFCNGFDNRMNLTSTLIMKEITPYEEGDVPEV